jgi:hypothetical protein
VLLVTTSIMDISRGATTFPHEAGHLAVLCEKENAVIVRMRRLAL